MIMTGIEIHITAFHSSTLRGTITKILAKNGTYKIIKWRTIDRVIAKTKYGFVHN
jgi:hypothetical protein